MNIHYKVKNGYIVMKIGSNILYNEQQYIVKYNIIQTMMNTMKSKIIILNEYIARGKQE